MWTHGIHIGDYKRVLIFDNPENDPGLNIRVTTDGQETYWNFSHDGHIYVGGNLLI